MQHKFTLLLVLAAILGCVHCESSDGDSLWTRLKSMVREFVDSMKKIWNDMKGEIEARTTGIGSWTKEMFNSFKIKMMEWVDQVGGASNIEKEDMRNYIERLQMPKESKK